MKPFLKALLKIILSGAALYYVYTKIDFHQVIGIFKVVNYYLLIPAFIFFIASKIASAWRLNYYFDAINIKLSNESNLRLYLLGMYYNLFLPGGIGGDGYKVWLLNNKYKIKAKNLFWGVMLDRINGVFALFILALLITPFLSIPNQFKFGSLVLLIISIIIYYIINKKFFLRFYQVIVPTTLYSFVVQIMQILSALFILFANKSYTNTEAYIFLFLISSIVAALPFTIGGIGSREITFLFGAKVLGLDINLSIALSLIFYLITLVVSIAGIYYSLRPTALKITPENQKNNSTNILS